MLCPDINGRGILFVLIMMGKPLLKQSNANVKKMLKQVKPLYIFNVFNSVFNTQIINRVT